MKTFAELGLNEPLLKAVAELGYESPMPVQEEVIPCLLENEGDVVALAQTGTGKTAAFGLPLLQKIDAYVPQPQALVLCPTRELCLQIADDLRDYAKYLTSLVVLPVYGGSNIEAQQRALRRGVQVIVATPGRLLDLISRGCADLTSVRNVVLDEADEMLNMGFSESLNAILESVPKQRNTLLFSATMPDEIARIAQRYMRSPKEIIIGRRNESTSTVRHIYYMVHAKDKYQTLKRIVDYYPNLYGIVFCRTKADTQELADKLMQDGYNADALHGDLSQSQRDYVMHRFRLRNIRLLVATDVAARGLDVDDLTHVLHYTLPDEAEAYTHRSGRTGRAGKTGVSIAIVHLKEKHRIRKIEQVIHKQFEAASMPTGKEICNKQVFNLIDRLEKVEVNENEIQDMLPSVCRKLSWLDKEDLIKRIVSLEFNRLIAYYQEADEIVTIEGKSKEKSRDKQANSTLQAEPGFTKLYLDLGKKDGITPKVLLDLINAGIDGRVDIGRIDLFGRYSLFDVEASSAKLVIRSLRAMNYFGRHLKVELASSQPLLPSSKGNSSKRQKDSVNGRASKKHGSKPPKKQRN